MLHRGCNVWLGKNENAIRINKLQDRIQRLLPPHVLQYMNSALPVYHHSFRTDEEKRIRRNKKAKKRRANKHPK